MTVRQRAGDYRHPGTIEYLTSASTDFTTRGQQSSPTWGQLAKVRFSMTPLRGTEQFQARQQFATATHLLGCRYVKNVTPSCRVKINGRTFAINDVANIEERNKELEIIATEERHG